VLSTKNRKAIVEVSALFEELEKGGPCVSAFSAAHKCVHVADHDDAASGPREKHIEPFRRRHEPDVSVLVASSQARNNDVALLPLVVVWKVSAEQCSRSKMLADRR
jgi:hypothetical protein